MKVVGTTIGSHAVRCAAALLVLATAPWVAAADGADDADAPVVDLSERVPKRWLSGRADKLPIRSPRWRRILPKRCHTRGGYRRHCQAPARVPEPHGAAAERAMRLALGQRATVLQLRLGHAFDEWLAAARGTDANPQLHFPVPEGTPGRGFGRTRRKELRGRPHFGIDIAAEQGTAVEAARGGLVVYSGNELTGFGNAVMILHEDDATTFYAHCRRNRVFAGQKVARGQTIAEVGETGFAAAAHLHFEWRTGGWARDPLPQMAERRYRR